MREILFRGKRKDNGEWVYGTPIFYSSGTTVMCNEYQRNENIDLKTVGQYTGLKDKNGTKIFEGDIVQESWYDYDEPVMDAFGIVYYNVGRCCCTVWDEERESIYDLCADGEYHWEVEVVGNIHDNPELLEGATSNEAINPAKI